MGNSKLGKILIFSSLFLTLILWILAKSSLNEIISSPLISLNQITALLGSILLSWSMFLSTRLDFLENWFGGLDKVYRVHRKAGEIGMVLIILHPLFLALGYVETGLRYFIPPTTMSPINIGIYSLWIFVIFILITLFIRKIKLPYHIWKQTHKFLNLAMILALLHVIMIQSDTSTFLILGIWIYLSLGLGVASGLYKTFFYKYFGPKYKYKIISVTKHGELYNVTLRPIKKKLHFNIAQFAYVAFHSEGISSESHPYCITSLPGEEVIKFSIKEFGDYTRSLGKLKVGDTATILGPYGKLGKRFEKGKEDSIFIAGGIGISPFISMFKKASLEKTKRKTTLFYCTKYREEVMFDGEFKKFASKDPRLCYQNQCSREKGGGHLTPVQILEKIRDINNTIIYLCGPSKMMVELKKDLIKEGIKNENIVLEDFEMI